MNGSSTVLSLYLLTAVNQPRKEWLRPQWSYLNWSFHPSVFSAASRYQLPQAALRASTPSWCINMHERYTHLAPFAFKALSHTIQLCKQIINTHWIQRNIIIYTVVWLCDKVVSYVPVNTTGNLDITSLREGQGGNMFMLSVRIFRCRQVAPAQKSHIYWAQTVDLWYYSVVIIQLYTICLPVIMLDK